MALEHLQQSRHADAGAVLAALLIGGGGMRLLGPEGLATVIRGAAAAGMPVAVHAIGDLANPY